MEENTNVNRRKRRPPKKKLNYQSFLLYAGISLLVLTIIVFISFLTLGNASDIRALVSGAKRTVFFNRLKIIAMVATIAALAFQFYVTYARGRNIWSKMNIFYLVGLAGAIIFTLNLGSVMRAMVAIGKTGTSLRGGDLGGMFGSAGSALYELDAAAANYKGALSVIALILTIVGFALASMTMNRLLKRRKREPSLSFSNASAKEGFSKAKDALSNFKNKVDTKISDADFFEDETTEEDSSVDPK